MSSTTSGLKGIGEKTMSMVNIKKESEVKEHKKMDPAVKIT